MGAIMNAIDKDNGIAGLLTSIAVILSLHLVMRVGSFLWGLKVEKDRLSEQTVKDLVKSVGENTTAVDDLRLEVKRFEAAVAEIPKLKLDLRRLYAALKIIAGEEWPNIRKEIMQDLGDI